MISLLALFIASFGLGAVFLTAIVVERIRAQMILTLVFGILALVLFAFGNSQDDLHAKVPPEAQANLALIGHSTAATFLVAAYATLAAAKILFSIKPQWRDTLRKYLVPRLWQSPDTSALSFYDMEKRWYVTVAAATGSVIGIRLIEPKAIEVIIESVTTSRAFITVFLTLVVVVFFGPGEDLILGANLKSSSETSAPRSHFEELLHNSSGRSWARVLLVLICFAAFNVAEKCMDDSFSSGHAQAALQMLLAAVSAGVVTYYWCAAIQRGVKSVSDSAFIASILFSGFLIVGMSLFFGIYCAYLGYSWFAVHAGAAIALAAFVFGGVLFTALAFGFFGILNIFQYGFVALAGGAAIDLDRAKPDRSSYLTVAKLIVFVALIQVFYMFAFFGMLDFFLKFVNEKTSDQALFDSLLSIVGKVVWGVGLYIAGFPKILEHGRASFPRAR